MRRRLLVSVGVLLASAAIASAQRRPTIDEVLALTIRYVGRLVNQFTSVVAEEQYVQRVDRAGGENRILKADFMLVNVGTARQWMPFRDVFEVNGIPIRDHDSRLVNLFVEHPTKGLEQAKAINAESYRFNIGFQRNINNPLLALAFVQDSYRARFDFKLNGSEKINNIPVWVVIYEERARPTVITGNLKNDLPARGRYWIDQSTGALLRTELLLEDSLTKSRVITHFEYDQKFGVAVPVRMEETHAPGVGIRTVATATYGRFRQFSVNTEEVLTTPLPDPGR
jgi:hypothetical protein